MTKIIIDTNIAFSAMLNINSRIGQILINGSKHYSFFSPEFIRSEIFEHQNKIKKIAKINDEEFHETYELIIKNVIILNHAVIPIEIFKQALKICGSIDIDDTAFVALTDYLKGQLWTGDKFLIEGLTKKGFKQIVTTEELYLDFLNKDRIKR